jgi:hypothetical protein
MSMPTAAVDEALGEVDVQVAGADDLVDPGHGFRSVGQGADRLRAADRVHFVNPGDRGCGERGVRDPPVAPGRRRHRDRAHAGDGRRNGGHQDRRRVGRGAARHVNPGTADGTDQLPEHLTRPRRVHPGLPRLFLVEGADTRRRRFQDGPQFGASYPCGGVLDLVGRDAQPVRAGPVPAPGILQDGGVAPPPHAIEDRPDGFLGRLRGRFQPAPEGGREFGKVVPAGIESLHAGPLYRRALRHVNRRRLPPKQTKLSGATGVLNL